MKVQGALWKQFYNDEEYWKGHYHDDVLITFGGVDPNAVRIRPCGKDRHVLAS